MVAYIDEALRLMESAVADCPDELWETDLWPAERADWPCDCRVKVRSLPGDRYTADATLDSQRLLRLRS